MSDNATILRSICSPFQGLNITANEQDLQKVVKNLLKDIEVETFCREESSAGLKTRELIGYLKIGSDTLNQIVPTKNRVALQKLCLFLVALLVFPEKNLLGLYKKKHLQLTLKDSSMLELLNIATKQFRLSMDSTTYCVDYDNPLISTFKMQTAACQVKIQPAITFFIPGVKIAGQETTLHIRIRTDKGVNLIIYYHEHPFYYKKPLKIEIEQMRDVHWDYSPNKFVLSLELNETDTERQLSGKQTVIKHYVYLDFPTKMEQILFYCFFKPRIAAFVRRAQLMGRPLKSIKLGLEYYTNENNVITGLLPQNVFTRKIGKSTSYNSYLQSRIDRSLYTRLK